MHACAAAVCALSCTSVSLPWLSERQSISRAATAKRRTAEQSRRWQQQISAKQHGRQPECTPATRHHQHPQWIKQQQQRNSLARHNKSIKLSTETNVANPPPERLT